MLNLFHPQTRKQVRDTQKDADMDGVKVPTTLAEYCVKTRLPSKDSSTNMDDVDDFGDDDYDLYEDYEEDEEQTTDDNEDYGDDDSGVNEDSWFR